MCGILAFTGERPDPAALAEALRLVEHRGQDGLGIWFCRASASTTHLRQTGRSELSLAGHLPAGHLTFVAHWRYATRGGSRIEDIHPVLIDGGEAAIAHNGQFQLQASGRGCLLSDTQLFSLRVESAKSASLVERIFTSLDGIGGAFAIAAADRSGITTARDRFGIRPMFWARYRGGVAFCSETPPLARLGCVDMQEISLGSVIAWTSGGPVARFSLPPARRASCCFESIYFHAPDGRMSGRSVGEVRRRLGQLLAGECPAGGDVVVPVPNSGTEFARGFADAAGMPLANAVSVAEDSARTFIEDAANRAMAIKRKYLLDSADIDGRTVVLVDDSLVRGATMKHLAAAMRAAGARAVHARIGSPRFTHPCFFGIDVPDRRQLICHGRELSEVCDLLGLTSLGFLSLGALHQVLGEEICTGCFSGRYPEGSLSTPGRAGMPGATPPHVSMADAPVAIEGERSAALATRSALRLQP